MNTALNRTTKAINGPNFNTNLYRETIIQSLCDIDVYKINMGQVAWELFPTAIAKYRFVNRGGDDLAPYIGEIRAELHKLEVVRFAEHQLQFMKKTMEWLKEGYINALRSIRLEPNRHLTVELNDEGELVIEAEGTWLEIIWYEIIILAIISEVRNRNQFPEAPHIKFREVLFKKIKKLKKRLAEENLEDEFKLIEFGTRRRLSYHAQSDCIDILAKELPNQFIGTSNLHMAIDKGIPFRGTVAHEYYCAHQAFYSLGDHLKQANRNWNLVFEGNLGIALPDSITTDAFLKDFDLGLANQYVGMRHDSGDPIVWGEKVIAHYEKLGIDPRTKQLIFSDGLNFDKAIDILKIFNGRIQVAFGIGTFLSNDLGDYTNEEGVPYKPLNIVMKLVEMNGQPVAKISDEPAKSVCDCPIYLANLKARFGIPVDKEALIQELAA